MTLPVWWKSSKPWIIADCLEVMKGMPDKCVDLIVTSPPYYNSSKRYQRGEGVHYSKDVGEPLYHIIEMMEEAERVVSGFVAINLGFSYGETGVMRPFRIVEQIMKRTGWFCVDVVIWHKPNPIPIRNRYTNSFEYIFIFNKHPNPEYPSKPNYEHNHIDCPVASYEGHSAIFPTKIPEKIINTFTSISGIVFDPYLGSGTTIEVSCGLKRIGLGCEINPEYEAIIEKRSMQNITKLDMFGGDEP